MKRPSGLSAVLHLSALVIAIAAGCSGSGTTPAPDRRVVVLFTSDEHSHLFAFSPELDDYPAATAPGSGTLVGGISRRAVVLAAARQAATAAGEDSILLSAGDNQMGGLSHTVFETASLDYGILQTFGYDVTTLGNHEFDFGPAALAEAITVAQHGGGLPPIVTSNIHFSTSSTADASLQALYSADVTQAAAMHPYHVITTSSGLRIGTLGIMGVNAEQVATNKTPVQFSSYSLPASDEGDATAVLPQIYLDIQPVVDTLRQTEKVDLVIALSHSGDNDTSTAAAAATGEDYQIAQNVSGIDFIVSGHAHNHDPTPLSVKNTATGATTLVLNGGAYGQEVGRVEFTIHADGSAPTWDTATQALLPVNDEAVPDPTVAKSLVGMLSTIEAGPYLPPLLSLTTGSTVTEDPAKPGDLFFYPVGQTAFDVTDTHALLYLSTDAMLTAADAWGAAAGATNDVAIDSAGVIRAALKQGKTGVISAADAFDVLPLGVGVTSPTIGYPLIRAYVYQIELRGVFEAALAFRAGNNQFDLAPSGLEVEYDATRPLATTLADLIDPTKGQVMRMVLDTNHTSGLDQYTNVIYDRTLGTGDATALYAVVVSSYVAAFASSAGVTLKDETGTAVTVEQALLTRPDGSEIKQLEAFFGYIHASPGGTLSSRYDVTSADAAQRLVCLAGC